MTDHSNWETVKEILDHPDSKYNDEQLRAIKLASHIMDVIFAWTKDTTSSGPMLVLANGDFVPFAIDMQVAVCKALGLPYKEPSEVQDDDSDGD